MVSADYNQHYHAVHSPAMRVLWVFVPGKLQSGFKTPLKLSVINLNCDIFIMFKASTQQGLIGSLAEPLCRVNPFPQESKMCCTGNAVEDFDCNVSSYIF